jgi:hypothetical protein
MKVLTFLLFIIGVSFISNSCGSAKAQDTLPSGATTAPLGVAILNGQYTYWGYGQYWGTAQDGGTALPPGIPATEAKLLFDSGTFDADGNGHATQCGAGAWGTWTTPTNCVTHWTVEFGNGDAQYGSTLPSRMGIITSDVGDKATIACTATGKHCVMTSHGVGWAWTQILDRE